MAISVDMLKKLSQKLGQVNEPEHEEISYPKWEQYIEDITSDIKAEMV